MHKRCLIRAEAVDLLHWHQAQLMLLFRHWPQPCFGNLERRMLGEELLWSYMRAALDLMVTLANQWRECLAVLIYIQGEASLAVAVWAFMPGARSSIFLKSIHIRTSEIYLRPGY